MGPPYGKLPILPYLSHIFRDSYGSGMGIAWVRRPIIGGPWKSQWNILEKLVLHPLAAIS